LILVYGKDKDTATCHISVHFTLNCFSLAVLLSNYVQFGTIILWHTRDITLNQC